MKELNERKINVSDTTKEKTRVSIDEKISWWSVCNMLRLVIAWARKHIYTCRAAFENEVEFEKWHTISFYPEKEKCVVIKWWKQIEFLKNEYYDIINDVLPILKTYFFTLENTDIF